MSCDFTFRLLKFITKKTNKKQTNKPQKKTRLYKQTEEPVYLRGID